MRFMKNSSRLLLTMARNLTRSSSGVSSCSAICRTRRLNSSQVSSRFRYHCGSSRSNFLRVAEALPRAGCCRVEVPAVRPAFADWLGMPRRRPDLVVRFGRAEPMPMSVRRPLEDVIIIDN